MSTSHESLMEEIAKLPIEMKRELLLVLIEELRGDSEISKAITIPENESKTKEIFQFHADKAESFEIDED